MISDAPQYNADSIAAHLAEVQARIIRASQEASFTHEVALVAVSKFHPAQAVYAATLAGQTVFGENYVQEALAKQEDTVLLCQKAPQEPPHWHFLGHIQSRKAKDVVGRFDLIHSVDSEKLARLLDSAATQKNIRQNVLIQVNIGAETQKSGVSIANLPSLAHTILQCPHLNLQGLMCLPPVFDAGLAARPYFALLRSLRNELEQQFSCHLPHLSMGMSGDLEAAILEGATLVRVGTDIFGQRQSVSVCTP